MSVTVFGVQYREWNIYGFDYYWYGNLHSSLYIDFPGANKVLLGLDSEDKNLIEGRIDKKGIYRFDLNDVIREIENSSIPWHSIIIYYSLPGDVRKSINLIDNILNRLWIETFNVYLNNSNQLECNVDFVGESKLMIDIYDLETKDCIVKDINLIKGKNILDMISYVNSYKFDCFMIRKDEFGLSYSKKPLNISYTYTPNLTIFHIKITSIFFDTNYIKLIDEYVITDITKDEIEDVVFYGKMEVRDKKGKVKTLFPKVKIVKPLNYDQIFIHNYSFEDKKWTDFVYDRETMSLLSIDDEIMNIKPSKSDSKKLSERFPILFEDEIQFICEFIL